MTQPAVMQLDGNDSGAVYDIKLNEIVQAHHTMFAGASAPVAPVADMLWQDKSVDPPYFKRRNSTNSAWDNMGQFSNQVFYGSITGHSATTDTLTTPRVISLAGDVTGSASFDGSANAPIAASLKVSNTSPGTYGNSTTVPVVTVNSKGITTSVTNQAIDFPIWSFNGRGDAVSLNSTDVFNVLPSKTGNERKYLTLSPDATSLEWTAPGLEAQQIIQQVTSTNTGSRTYELMNAYGPGLYRVAVRSTPGGTLERAHTVRIMADPVVGGGTPANAVVPYAELPNPLVYPLGVGAATNNYDGGGILTGVVLQPWELTGTSGLTVEILAHVSTREITVWKL